MQYYAYSKEELLNAPKIPIEVMESNAIVFQSMAREMADLIVENNQKNKPSVFICPVGPIGQYSYFINLVCERRIDLKNTWFFNMDEYLTEEDEWIDENHKLSFRGFMNREVYRKLPGDLAMPVSQRVFPDPKYPEKIFRKITELGGVDICFGGIGINGHIAFNEPKNISPMEFAELPTRVLDISRETITANAIGDLHGAIEAMPRRCVTIGFKEIVSARRIRLGVFRDWHKAVIRRAAHGNVSAKFPVSILQAHPDVKIYCTEFVANLDDADNA